MKKNLFLSIPLSMLILLFLSGCSKDPGFAIVTKSATRITTNSALTGGKIPDTKVSPPKEFGVCWATHSTPTINDNVIAGEGDYTNFDCKMTGLVRATRYYARAYAINEVGIVYAPAIMFLTRAVSTITTIPVEKFTQNMALSGGNIVENEDKIGLVRGVCWSTNPEPTLNDNKTINGAGGGMFESILTGLTQNTKYYVRAFAKDAEKIDYADQVEFTTLPDGIVIDIEGNQYTTAVVNEKEWMAQNLRVMRYENNDAIITNLSNTEWYETSMGSCAIYPYSSLEGINSAGEMRKAYGVLYNWHAVKDARKICPFGWRMPTVDEWMELINYVGNDNAAQLKSCRQVNSPVAGCATAEHPRWEESSVSFGTDNFSFGALPSGMRNLDGDFSSIGLEGLWWTKTEQNYENAFFVTMYYNSNAIDTTVVQKTSGFAVRCVKEQ